MRLGDRLGAYVEGALWRDLSEFLDGLDEVGLKEARDWYRQGRGQARRAAEESLGPGNTRESGAACVQLLALRLAPTPRKAAEWFGWGLPGEFGEVAEPVVLRKLAACGREWCADFVQAASEVRFRGQAVVDADRVVRYTMPLLAHFGLPMPSGPAYGLGWAGYYTGLKFRVSWAGNPHRDDEPDFIGQTWLAADGTAIESASVLETPTLVDAWRRDPVLGDALAACLAAPGEIGRFAAPVAAEGWEVGPAVAAMVGEGKLDRDSVLEACFGALTRQENPSSNKTIAGIIAGLDVSATELRGRIPLLQGVMASCHGSLTAVLLSPVIDALSSAAELEELATTVFSRKEKKQQNALLKVVLAKDAVERLGRESVVAVLSKVVLTGDEALVTKAGSALAKLGVAAAEPAAVSMDGLWIDVPTAPVERFGRIAPEPPGIAAALTAMEIEGDAGFLARYLDALVRWAWSDVDVVKRWFREHGAGFVTDPIGQRTVDWANGRVTGKSFAAYAELAGQYHGGGRRFFPGEDWVLAESPVTAVFADLHLQECLLNAGRVPYLLSTPSRSTGVLEFDDLLARLGGYRSVQCGSLDLFQALLRLEPVSPDRLAELPDVVLPVFRPGAEGLLSRLTGRRGESVDAITVIRQWVEGGGLPPIVARTGDDGMTSIEPVELPVELFPGVPQDLVGGYRAIHVTPGVGFDPARTIGVVPRWPDLIAARMQEAFSGEAKWAPPWLDQLVLPGAGRAVHQLLAITIGFPDEHSRLRGIDALLALMGREEFDSELLTEFVLGRFARGSLPLARTSWSLEQAVLAGGLKPLWPTVLALVDASCSAAKSPPGLAGLLAVVRRYLPAVPDPVLPSGVRELAARRGSTKAGAEARALVAVAEGLAADPGGFAEPRTPAGPTGTADAAVAVDVAGGRVVRG